jgi:uncharacterized membrane protein
MVRAMQILETLKIRPSDPQLRKLFLIGIGLLIIIYPLMGYFMFIAQVPNDPYIQGQLSFSGQYLKDLYFQIGSLEAYRTGQILDYCFMLSYGIFFFAFTLRLARKFESTHILNKVGRIMAICAIAAALFDVCENIFILITLADPFNFPDGLAIAHSVFALIKWLLLSSVLIWDILLIIKKS